MSVAANAVQVWHELLLKTVLEWKSRHPGFTCSLRKKDTNARLSDGYWFHGSEKYILLGLFKPNDQHNKTPTVGLGFDLDPKTAVIRNAKLEIAYPHELNVVDEPLYLEMVDACAYPRHPNGKRFYTIPLQGTDPASVVTTFLQTIYPAMLDRIRAAGAEEKFLISEEEFQTRLARILAVKATMVSQDNVPQGPLAPRSKTDPAPEQRTGTVNAIFYGPPGTGKTRNIQAILKSASHEMSSSFRSLWNGASYADENDDEGALDDIFQDADWFPSIFATLALTGKPMSIADIVASPWIRAKAALLGKTRHIASTVSATLQHHAVEGSKYGTAGARHAPQLVDSNALGEWSIAVPGWQSHDDELRRTVDAVQAMSMDVPAPSRRFEWVTFHPSYSYEEFVEGFRPGGEGNTSGFALQDGVFKRLCIRARSEPEKKFALFIDEINRANIAKVFGELITLIEPGKRVQPSEAPFTGRGIWVTLPYSGEPFGVPANLDLYGTMNTADRSIAAIDIALRRRFQFIDCPPEPESLPTFKNGAVDLAALLRTLNQRIEYFLGRDYLLGHAYFHTKPELELTDLQNIFANNIIPLLQEYFFDDWQKIGLVLGNTAGKCQFLDSSGPLKAKDLFFGYGDGVPQEDRPSYKCTARTDWTIQTFTALYRQERDTAAQAKDGHDPH